MRRILDLGALVPLGDVAGDFAAAEFRRDDGVAVPLGALSTVDEVGEVDVPK